MRDVPLVGLGLAAQLFAAPARSAWARSDAEPRSPGTLHHGHDDVPRDGRPIGKPWRDGQESVSPAEEHWSPTGIWGSDGRWPRYFRAWPSSAAGTTGCSTCWTSSPRSSRPRPARWRRSSLTMTIRRRGRAPFGRGAGPAVAPGQGQGADWPTVATLTKNRVQPKAPGVPAFEMLTTPIPLQRRAIGAPVSGAPSSSSCTDAGRRGA